MNTPSWTDLGANLAPFWGGSGGQVGAKSMPKSNQKLIEIKIKFAMHFCSVLGPNLAPKWADLGASWDPKPPQNSSQSDIEKDGYQKVMQVGLRRLRGTQDEVVSSLKNS